MEQENTQEDVIEIQEPVIIKIKVKYNATTTKVEGYFPSSINYKNNVIDEEAKTIDGSPYIEVFEAEHQAALGKIMCVVNDSLQEYVPTDTEILERTKASKTGQCKSYLNSTDWQHVAFTERGRDYKDVKEKRLKAVSTQDLIEACTTLDELNNINTDF